MIYLPLERLLRIATGQTAPEVRVGASRLQAMALAPVAPPTGGVDTCLAARMVANSLAVLLRDGCWQRRQLGARAQVGEMLGVRLLVWMDSRDDQPGMVALWDMTGETPSGKTAYGAVLPRPMLVVGRNALTGAHFVMRYAPGDWLERLQQIAGEARRSAS